MSSSSFDSRFISKITPGSIPTVFNIAEKQASKLPGPEETVSHFAHGISQAEDNRLTDLDRRNGIIRCIAAVESISDPSLTLKTAFNVLETVSAAATRNLYEGASITKQPHSAADEAERFANSMRESLPEIVTAFRSRNAIAAVVAEAARRNGFGATGVIVDPTNDDPQPIYVLLERHGQKFGISAHGKNVTLDSPAAITSYDIPLSYPEWINNVIKDHRIAHKEPDQQAALVRLQLLIDPHDVTLQRQFLVYLKLMGREDIANDILRLDAERKK